MDIRKWMAVIAMVAVAGCSGEEQGQRVPIGDEPAQSGGRADWPAGLAVQVDSANAEYSQGDYEAAAERYRTLTEEYPDVGTVWFGLYMAENALGNTEAAEAALARSEELAPGLGQMHDAAESGGMGSALDGSLPSGHPDLDSVDAEDAPPLDGSGG